MGYICRVPVEPMAAPSTTEVRARPSRAAAAAAAKHRLRVLAITRIFPNAVEPLSSPFNRQQFGALGRLRFS